ncbi:hypothetical protein CHARACLAT_022849 [Characodon lateralis]|uniref:Uncharacterized protein n=1 Tax=Characodon lateralis TaxID=208331 RepID=A0ABU7CZZ7_9TELE|nr:hypothetical protein [Characodon lateralis]
MVPISSSLRARGRIHPGQVTNGSQVKNIGLRPENLVVVFRFIGDRVAGAADSAETPRRPCPQTPPPAPPGGAQGVPRSAERL